MKWVQKGERPPRGEISSMRPVVGNWWNQFSRLTMISGLLYRNFEDESGNIKYIQLCVPQKLVKGVLETLHDSPSAGHPGSKRMADVLRKRFYWKGWFTDIEDYCKNCQTCAQRNPPRRKPRAPLVLDKPGYPMERVAMDVIGPLPKTPRGNRFVLVVVDYFTRWPEAYAVPDQTALTVSQKLVEE